MLHKQDILPDVVFVLQCFKSAFLFSPCVFFFLFLLLPEM